MGSLLKLVFDHSLVCGVRFDNIVNIFVQYSILYTVVNIGV